MGESKTVMINLKVRTELREEFRVAADLEGMDMSTMLRNFMIRAVREAKERDPNAFHDSGDKQARDKPGTGGLNKSKGVSGLKG